MPTNIDTGLTVQDALHADHSPHIFTMSNGDLAVIYYNGSVLVYRTKSAGAWSATTTITVQVAGDAPLLLSYITRNGDTLYINCSNDPIGTGHNEWFQLVYNTGTHAFAITNGGSDPAADGVAIAHGMAYSTGGSPVLEDIHGNYLYAGANASMTVLNDAVGTYGVLTPAANTGMVSGVTTAVFLAYQGDATASTLHVDLVAGATVTSEAPPSPAAALKAVTAVYDGTNFTFVANENNAKLRYLLRTGTNAYGSWTDILSDSSLVGEPALCEKANGDLLLFYRTNKNFANGEIWYVTRIGGAWGTPSLLAGGSNAGWADPSCAPNDLNDAGNARVVYVTGTASTWTLVEDVAVWAIAANPFKNSASFMVQATKGGRPARRRVGYWHTVADQISGWMLDIPLAQGIPIVVVYRGRKLPLRVSTPGDLPTLGATNPRLNSAQSWTQSLRAGRPLRRRAGFWRYTVSSQGTSIGHGSDTPDHTNSPSPVMGAQRGRPQRRRAGQWHRASTETNTVYQDSVIGVPADRSWRAWVPRFKVWEQSAAYLGDWFNQPFRKLAEWMVQAGRGGRAARRRVGFWHTIADSASTLLQSEIPQLGNYAVWIQSGKVRSRRRAGLQHRSAEGSYTVFQDSVVSQAQDRASWRARVPVFRNRDFPVGEWIAAFNTLFPLTKKLAEVFVQAGRGGRAARRRVGTWHQMADQSNTSLQALSELPQVGLADSFVQSGKVRSRRRAGQQHQGSQETKTVFQDSVISQPQDRGWRARVPRSRVWETSPGFLANLGALAQPLRQLASWMVQATRGGRPARRRVGAWHQMADQSNTSLLAQSELPQVGLADNFIQSGKVRSRRRAGQQHQASQETKTLFQDSVVSQASDRSWRARVPRFLSNDQPGVRLATWLNQPFRKLAEWWVQGGRGGRAARRRVGTWHQTADQANTSLQSSAELPPRMLADVWSMSGRVRGRRRAGPTHQTSNETKTVFGDQMISQASESKQVRKLPRLANWWQTASNWLLNLFTLPTPGRITASVSTVYTVTSALATVNSIAAATSAPYTVTATAFPAQP